MAHREREVISLTFLLYPCEDDPQRRVAHCLELDVVAVEHTMPKAIELLKQLIEDLFHTAAEDGTLHKVFRPAPDRYWEMLAQATRYEPPKRVVEHRIKADRVRSVGYALATT